MPKKKFSFVWDAGNTIKNWVKHKVRPYEAEEAFKDTNALLAPDLEHSEEENRFILLGKTRKGRILYIAFTLRKGRIRVISARDAGRKEVQLYEKETNSTTV